MKKKELPPKPPCGSIESNKMIRAINEGKPNPCTENQECIDEWNRMMLYKKMQPDVYFSCVDPDYYEECLLKRLL